MHVREILVFQAPSREIDPGSGQICQRIPAGGNTLLDRVNRCRGNCDRLPGELDPGLQRQALEIAPRGLSRLIQARQFRLGFEYRQPCPGGGDTVFSLATFECPDKPDGCLGEIGTREFSGAEYVFDLDVELDGRPEARLLYAALLRLDRVAECAQLGVRFQRICYRFIETDYPGCLRAA